MMARLIVIYTLLGASLIVSYAHMVAHIGY